MPYLHHRIGALGEPPGDPFVGQEAEEKRGAQQLLSEHFAKVYKVSLPLVA